MSFTWQPNEALMKKEMEETIFVTIPSKKIHKAIKWLEERLERSEWNFSPAFGESGKTLFWFRRVEDANTAMLFKLTFGGV